MDLLKNAMSGGNKQSENNNQNTSGEEEGGAGGRGRGGFLGGVDAVQQYGLGEGDQSNESAFQQAKDEQVSDEIRREFKSATGVDVPIRDKETRFG